MEKFKRKNFTISKEHGEALEESIASWERKQAGGDDWEACALCEYNDKMRPVGQDGCDYCVIKMHTGRRLCCGTPFYGAFGANEKTTQLVIFLKNLRVYETPVKVGIIARIKALYSVIIGRNVIIDGEA